MRTVVGCIQVIVRLSHFPFPLTPKDGPHSSGTHDGPSNPGTQTSTPYTRSRIFILCYGYLRNPASPVL